MRRFLISLVLIGATLSLWASAPALYERALERYHAGHPEEAAPLLEQAIREGGAGPAYGALLGWSRLRLGELEEAAAAFSAALEAGPSAGEALTGMGFVRLRQGRVDEAASAFIGALAADEGNADAWKGLALVHRRRGEPAASLIALERAVEVAPADPEARELLEQARRERQVTEEVRPRGPVSEAPAPDLRVRARAGAFEIRDGGDWRPFYVKGVNLGTALPGKFPAEFPDDPDLYARWFRQIADMGANTIRLYTLHPPSLYRALREHNRKYPTARLWLIQGVWATLPANHQFDEPGYRSALAAEVRRVVDAVHGNLELPARPGHAHGVYDADISGDLLGWILGREWEPFAVKAYNDARGERGRHTGRFVQAEASPFEVWLAWLCDTAVEHEMQQYGSQRPVAFASWPTLDPLVHPTETTREEEWILQELEVSADQRREPAYDEDAVSVDASRLRATPAFAAGLFASYHAYPYYPDFMLLDPEYAGHPRGRYFAYLTALRRHHGEMPVLIAEFGVPSSRGIAHLHPEGFHHGGHDEQAQGEINARLAADIHAAGMAGGVVFEWVDEWFKRNWIVSRRQSPAERVPFWFSAQDAEQNFGLVAARPGPEDAGVVLDGSLADWSGRPPLMSKAAGRVRSMRVDHDEGWLYLALELDAAFDPERDELWIGIDTYDARRGSRRLPHPDAASAGVGLEFLLTIDAAGARLLVDRPYQVFAGSYLRPWRSLPNDDADFVEMVAVPNRERWMRDGARVPARTYSRSPLRHGTTRPGVAGYDSLADWYLDSQRGRLEIRLPWGLLHVADPSSHRVIHEEGSPAGLAQTVATEGFRFHVIALRDGEPVDVLPAAATADSYPVYRWDRWEQPTFHLRTKRSYTLMRDAYRGLPDRPARFSAVDSPQLHRKAGR